MPRKRRLGRRRNAQSERGKPVRAARVRGVFGRRLRYESLESRRLLAITVDTLIDEADGSIADGDISLRDAIAAASAGETIDFQAALTSGGPATMTLTLGQLVINKLLTISGPGANLLTIDASGNDLTPNSRPDDATSANDGDGSRVMNIDDGQSGAVNVTIHGLTLTGGDVNGDGGAIRAMENLTLTSSVIANNFSIRVGSLGGQGGAIRAFGDLMVTASAISGNAADSGGGIRASGAVAILDSSITGNNAATDGGGIRTQGSAAIMVTTSTLSKNAAGARGGGMVTAPGNAVMIVDSMIADNSAGTMGLVGFGRGGGIHAQGNVTVKSSTVSGNSSGFGGGIEAFGLVTFSDGTVAENSSRYSGGGIYAAAVSVANSTVSDNSAGTVGGGISADNVTVTGSMFSKNDADFGGAIGSNSPNGDVEVSSSTLTQNTAATAGGGIFAQGLAVVNFSTISGNSAHGGGGIFGGTLAVYSSTVAENAAVVTIDKGQEIGGFGGGIYAHGPSKIRSSTITKNTASRGNGGGIDAVGALSISFSTIAENSADSAGGIRAGSEPVTIERSIVAANLGKMNAPDDIVGTINASFTLVGTRSGATISDKGGNLIGTSAMPINPLLAPLADNGGPTPTRALLAGSPAINRGGLHAIAGVGDIPVYDQRGIPFGRVVNARFDLGAFEFQEASDLNLIVDTLVDESDDSFVPGDLSLREAVELANSFPSTDTIRFDPALSTSGPAEIVLSMGELAISDDVSIEGFGMGLLVIDASGNDPTPDMNNADGTRVFNIDDGNSDERIEVGISSLTVTGGDVTGGGGGIRSVEDLTVSASAVRGNSNMNGLTEVNAAGGGGIFSAGDLTVVGSTIQENSSTGSNFSRGGGIHVSRGNLEVLGSVIDGNESRIGGGITIFHLGDGPFLATARINNSTITGNQAEGGGGIFSIAANLAVSGSTISENSVSGAQGSGGGIHTRGSGSLTVTNCTISENTSSFEGGGITSTSPLMLIETTISGNTAKEHGGGAYVFSSLTVIESILTGNAARRGGGMFKITTYGHIDVQGSTISGNTADFDGGGIFSLGSQTNVTDSIISGNSAGNDGGGISQGGNAITVTNSTIDDNSVGGDGGGMAANNATTTITDTTISDNTAKENGGGIWQNRGTITVSDSTIVDNSAEVSGGGIFVANVANSTVNGSMINNNSAGNDGGGIFHRNENEPPNPVSILTVSETTIHENSASVRGGGIFNDRGRLAVNMSHLSDNTAESNGGGIANDSGHLTLAASTLSGNSATVGGGLSHYGNLFAPGAMEVTSSTLSGNSAMLGGGAFLFPSSFETPAIRHSTLADNSASNAGGGLFVVGSHLDLNHTLIATNKAPFGPDLTGFLGAGLNAHFSLIGNGSNSGLAEAAIGAPDANGNLVGGPLNGIIDPKLGPIWRKTAE